jgi:two-component system, chemotaxis family, chemotaxis protein CheY
MSYDIINSVFSYKNQIQNSYKEFRYRMIRRMKMAGKNILIVDDAAFMRMMIKDILTKNGFNVVGEAENGLKAVEKYSELSPDLVIMDITMPEMDGIEAVKAIKGINASANIIMCSAMGQQAMVIESIQAGAKDFIVKPFQADRVIEAVTKVTG